MAVLFLKQQAFISALAKTNIKKWLFTIQTDLQKSTQATLTAISGMDIGSQFLISYRARNISSRTRSWFPAQGQPCIFLLGRNTTALSYGTGNIRYSHTSEPVNHDTAFVVVVSISTSSCAAGGEASNVEEHTRLFFFSAC